MANATVAIDVVADVRDAVSGLDDVGEAAADMARDVARSSSAAGRGLDGVADGADNLDSKASQATGALGALSAGFELVGAEKYATGLQSAAMATDFLSGVGGALNLVMNTQAITTARAAVTGAAHRASLLAQRAATIAMTVSTRALNLAMRANPIGLVITAAIALGALLVGLYRKNETFRSAVQRAGDVGKRALGFIVDAARDVRDWLGKLGGPARRMGAAVKAGVDIALAPFRALKDILDDIINLIGKIDFPDIPDGIKNLGGLLGRSAIGRGPLPGPEAEAPPSVLIQVNGALDPDSVARQIDQLLRRREVRLAGVRYA